MSTGSEAEPTESAPTLEDTVLPKEGDVLAGKYLIDRVLGQGGMGVVVAAHHQALRQKVAVKFLLPEAAKRTEATERFLREARAAVAIQSEHVARVMDVGTLESGSPYMVMELLSGSDLNDVLKQRGPLPIPQAIDFILQACEAIAEAHSLGIIHRDLKPANLFLTARADGSPLVKVLDFGLSKATKPDALDASLTAANVVMGSPFYMSPEQIRSLKGIDQRSDIWSLGVILYQLLTGLRPFEGESLGGLFLMIGADPAVPPRDHRPDLPPELDAAILRCLEKEPARRPQTVAELARMLAPFGPEEARVSVERIHGVLADATPLARRSSLTSEVSGGIAVDPALRATATSSPSMPPSPSPIALAMSAPSALVADRVDSGSGPHVKSGSMAAIATDGPATQPAPAAKGKRSAAVAITIAGVAMAAVAAVAVMGMRGSPKPDVVPAVASSAGPDLGATSAAPAVTQAPAASAAPPIEPTATTSAAAPSASGSTEPAASAKSKKPDKGARPSGPPKKHKDPLDRWR